MHGVRWGHGGRKIPGDDVRDPEGRSEARHGGKKACRLGRTQLEDVWGEPGEDVR